MKKFIPVIALAGIIIAAASFFGGMQYAQAKGVKAGRGNLPEGFGQRMGGDLGNGDRQMGARNNMVMGEILSKDDQSITVKMSDGGSKIVFFSTSTEIGKEVEASIQDLEVGKSVSANGSVNTDGSIVAKTIQLRERLPLMIGGQGEAPAAKQ